MRLTFGLGLNAFVLAQARMDLFLSESEAAAQEHGLSRFGTLKRSSSRRMAALAANLGVLQCDAEALCCHSMTGSPLLEKK